MVEGDFGVKSSDINKIILVGGVTHMPKVVKTVKTSLGCDPFKAVNSDETMVINASIQGGIFAGNVTNILLLDVMPLLLGMSSHLMVLTWVLGIGGGKFQVA